MNPASQETTPLDITSPTSRPTPHKKRCLRRASCLIAALLLFLGAAAGADYLLTTHLYEVRREKEIKSATEFLDQKAKGLRERFLQETNRIRGIPAMIGDEKQVIDALMNFNTANSQDRLKTEAASARQDLADISALNRHLDLVAKELGYDAVWIINKAGFVIASGGAKQSERQGEEGFGDRIFFQQAVAGERGFQYAVGQIKSMPNLYFSAPAFNGQDIIGVVAIKIPASRLQRFVENDEVFITEENGIIIAAHDPDMVMRSTDPGRLDLLSKDQRLTIYKKQDFAPLNIRPAGHKQFPQLMQIDGWPGYYLFSKCTYCDCGLSLQAYTRISRLDDIKAETFLVSLFAIAGGAAVVLLLIGAVVHIHRIRRDNKQLQMTEIELLALNKELDAQRQIAEQASRSKSEFLANMSHEIRTPLNGVLATAELLSKTNLDGLQTKYVDIIRSSGELLLVVINDILDLSKIEAGKIDFQPACIDLRHEADITASLFAAQARAKGLHFAIRVTDDVPPRIDADPYRLRQVVANLVSNALKYTDHGSVEAVFSLAGNGHNRKIRFAVTDTGSGIPAEAQNLIFEKFTQMNRKASINGTGLGLPICQALIEIMDGEIGVESDGVHGSTFWFEIPLLVSAAEEKPCNQPAEAGGQQISHEGCRVLLVEDIEINRFVISEMLNELNCVVETANDGKQALEMMGRKTYDLVFMDCTMPVMNGYDATRELRKTGDATTPVIALTAHTFPEEADKCMKSGMNDFISKPVKLEHLSKALDTWHTPGHKPSTPGFASSHQSVDLPAFDLSALDGWNSSMPGKTGKLIELTMKDSERLYGEIAQAYAQRNAGELAESAHALKSVSRQIGGNELSGLCAELETAGKNGGMDHAADTFEKFRVSYQAYFKSLITAQAKFEGHEQT